MKATNYTLYISFCLLVVLLASSCKHHGEEYHTITDKIKAKSLEYKGTSISSEKFIEGQDLIKISEDGHEFLITERKGKIKSFACTDCHTKPLKNMKSNDFKKAHWNIKLNHADSNTMNCITCHNSKNINSLHSLTGKDIDFNKSYKLCSQCHTKQYKDWLGGAHGKRIESWAPPRASKTCVDCHNPHKPHFETRWPVRYNTQTVNQRK
jgi:hypothetical protein